MKVIALLSLLTIAHISKGQYKSFSVTSHNDGLTLLQVDNTETSTLLHFKLIVPRDQIGAICMNEDTYLQDLETKKKYHLLSSINIPFCDRYHSMEDNFIHQFTLEFENLPDSIRSFNFKENSENGFFVNNIQIDYNQVSELCDISEFIEDYPVTERSVFYKEGEEIQQIKYNGIYMAAYVVGSSSYGRYYRVNFIIQNQSGRSILFNPDHITAQLYDSEGLEIDTYILSFDEYSHKVENRQAFAAFAKSYSESMAASNAGYSKTTSSSNSSATAYGNVGNTYGSVYANSYTTTYSRTYDGAAAYNARQSANRNIQEFNQQQKQIKQTLYEGYAKINTIPNETEYVAYINMKYKKAKNLTFVIPINGKEFIFYLK